MNFAFRDGRVASDEAWRRVQAFRGARLAPHRYLTVEVDEADRLLKACPDDFRRLVRGALESAARLSELARLRVDDFDVNAGTLVVRQSKSGKSRHVVLSPDGAKFFRGVAKGRAGDEVLFLKANGAPWRKAEQPGP